MTPDKLAAWLKEDILLRRVLAPQGRRSCAHKKRQRQGDAAALAEAEHLSKTLQVPLAEVPRLLAVDREDYVPPAALAEALRGAEEQGPRGGDLEGALLKKGTVESYIAAVMELWRLQVAHGGRNTDNPRSEAVRGFLDQRGRQRGKHDRESYRDRGIDGIQAGYSATEWFNVQDVLLRGIAHSPQNLRIRVDLLMGHYYLLRGENRRKMELADLSLLDYPPSEGPTPCGCLVVLLRDGKMNKAAKKEFMGSLRHKDPMFCTQSALAQLLFWRWHIAGEAPPSFRRRQDWYRIKVLVGQDRQKEISYPTQLQDTWRIFGEIGLTAAKKTHLPRSSGAQHAEIHGTSLAQISQAGRWNQSVLCQAYLTHLPRQFMRIAAGFSSSTGDYFLPRAAHEPPLVLQQQIWPWIEEWEKRFEARAQRRGWAEGGLDETDLAGDGFLKLMKRLRTVLLQDLAVLQPRYPSLPFFSYSPFHGPAWDEFALALRADAAVEEPQNLLLQRALPEINSVLVSTCEAILHNSNRLANKLEQDFEHKLDKLKSSLAVLINNQIPVTLTGYFGPPHPPNHPQGRVPQGVRQHTAQTHLQESTPFLAQPVPNPALSALPNPPSGQGITMPPVFSSLIKVYTVKDVWREWKEGLAGRPPIKELEQTWGSRWRPGNRIRVQFCRRKVIWDELQARIASGKREEEAISELESLRADRNLNQLVNELKQHRQQQIRSSTEETGDASMRVEAT